MSEQDAPDPSRSYERSDPANEPGMGDLDAPPGTPTDSPDQMDEAVDNVREPAEEEIGQQIDERHEVDPTEESKSD